MSEKLQTGCSEINRRRFALVSVPLPDIKPDQRQKHVFATCGMNFLASPKNIHQRSVSEACRQKNPRDGFLAQNRDTWPAANCAAASVAQFQIRKLSRFFPSSSRKRRTNSRFSKSDAGKLVAMMACSKRETLET